MTPDVPASGGGDCATVLFRSAGSFGVSCEEAKGTTPLSAIDAAVITRIWEAEGQPGAGWELQLVGGEQPHWRATIDHTTRSYTLEGDQLER